VKFVTQECEQRLNPKNKRTPDLSQASEAWPRVTPDVPTYCAGATSPILPPCSWRAPCSSSGWAAVAGGSCVGIFGIFSARVADGGKRRELPTNVKIL
jgi:hypothetical protein